MHVNCVRIIGVMCLVVWLMMIRIVMIRFVMTGFIMAMFVVAGFFMAVFVVAGFMIPMLFPCSALAAAQQTNMLRQRHHVCLPGQGAQWFFQKGLYIRADPEHGLR